MKKVFIFVLLLIALLCIVACDDSKNNSVKFTDGELTLEFFPNNKVFVYDPNGKIISKNGTASYTKTEGTGLHVYLAGSVEFNLFKSQSTTSYITNFDQLITLKKIYSYDYHGPTYQPVNKVK